jgi:hypothetical protein
MPSVAELLYSLNKSNLHIVETGNQFTRDIARWVSLHPDSEFISADLDFQAQLKAHSELEQDRTARYCRFLTQTHDKVLSDKTWLDAVFLHPYDLDAGLIEFLLAVSTGAGIIVMTDYQTRAYFAIRRAKEIGWQYESAGNMNILRRPK